MAEIWFTDVSNQFGKASNAYVNTTYLSSSCMSDYLREIQNGTITSSKGTLPDAAIISGDDFPELAYSGKITEVGISLSSFTNYASNDIYPTFGDENTFFYGNVSAIPLDGGTLVLYFRQDVFNHLSLSVPQSWDDLISVAAYIDAHELPVPMYNVSYGADIGMETQIDTYDIAASNRTIRGFCLRSIQNVFTTSCDTSILFRAILATYLQQNGLNQSDWSKGFPFTSETSSAGYARAVEVYRSLYNISTANGTYILSSTSQINQCYDNSAISVSGLLADLDCAMAIETSSQFKTYQEVFSVLGVGDMPGALEVCSGSSCQLCTTDLCPSA
eukprot:CAMPEP_0175074274 /NCGR_PEP_ID=MMETSP0052_2-20121109/21188_1 /TAXON_ID=51329 ORGANISM="Polytomella parva, Strain SAG 63-3" /NCGR_SAMPLE_ID=MMETSP0052_2 /ASSEMBLY_ACC=CAM_ASM_000194 /LENGTH=330 /DNA_ID=CAMNT_0016342499 /DNA_START=252 /DNA_END=1241 /DNA_ORIENTATION=-